MAEEKVKLEIEVPKEALLKHVNNQQKKSANETEEDKTQKKKKEEKSEGKERPGIASYDPAEILKAPFESPDPVNKKRPNRHQQRMILLGFIFILISPFLFAFINFTAFVVMALAGAFIIAFGTLVKV